MAMKPTSPIHFFLSLVFVIASLTIYLMGGGGRDGYTHLARLTTIGDGAMGISPLCRKKKTVHKTTTTDDKRLQSTLKRIGVNAIPAIEEVNIFKDDVVIQFQNPKVQASIAANTWVISGSPQTKRLQDLLPTIIIQLATATVPVPSAKVPQVNTKVENGPLTTLPSDKYQNVPVLDSAIEPTVSITIVGASGDLAKKKIFPALFALYYEDCLLKHFTIFGYARSKMTDAELRNMVSRTLTCRIDKRENCNDKMDEILRRCFYHSGQYDSQENFAELDKKLKEHETGEDHEVFICSDMQSVIKV